MTPNETNAPTPSHLPALLPPASAVLQRTQGALGLLREVVQENSAEYWLEIGKKARLHNDWDKAIYSYLKCRETPGDLKRIESLEGLVEVLEIRAAHKAHNDDLEGSYWDMRSADHSSEELAYWVSCAEDYWSS